MGENTLEAVLAISIRLSSGDVPKHVASKAKSVFFDVGGFFMVSISLLVVAFWSVPLCFSQVVDSAD